MSSNTSRVSDKSRKNPSPTLTERVTARVSEASLALDAAPGKPNSKLKASKRSARPASTLKGGLAAEREAQSLRSVYREMRATYRGYRRQTGKPAVPALREAVRAFKAGQSLTSLVGVATFLDDRGLLAW